LVADEEFPDVHSLADVPRLTPDRLKRFRQLLDEIDREERRSKGE
jgi:hypothetical protein